MNKLRNSLQDEIDPTIKPGDNFYNYVNQKWLNAHPIPASKSRMGAFTVLHDENTDRLHKLLEAPVADDETGSSTKAKAFYHAAMDEATIEKTGLKPLQPTLNAIEALTSPAAIKAHIGRQHASGRGVLWHIGLDIDNKNSQQYVMTLDQSGLGLPDRDYYFEDGKRFIEARKKYRQFLAELFTLLGKSNTKKRAQNVYDLEEKLAKVSATAVERRDVDARYNPYTLKQLQKEFPSLDWVAYTAAVGFTIRSKVIISQPKFLQAALALLDSEDVEVWQDYMTVRYIAPLMHALPAAYDQLYFNFFGKVLSGTQEQEPRYRRAISSCTHLLPEPTGQLFVEAYFDSNAKAAIYDLVEHIQDALRERITDLPWMTEVTKKRALEKLDTFMPLLGYPDVWKDYSSLRLGKTYVENLLAVRQFEWQHDMHRLNNPVDPKEWLMSPAEVNAYYWPNTNGITFPAAILQSPFFDAKGDFAANYGGIGMVIGHEIIHGFDDKGAKFDKFGNLQSWWTAEDQKDFNLRAKQLEDQYSAYKVEGRHVNGSLTLGENIADLGGMLLAYEALQEKLTETGERPLVDGFTPEQRFFMAQARIWREERRPELALRLLVSDPHSPNDLRVNGVITNVDAFYDTFDIQPGSALYKSPEDRIRIW